MADGYTSFGDRVSAYMCPGKLTEKLTGAEIAALHAFKVGLAALFFTLYETMDPKAADDFVASLLKQLAG